MYTEKDGVYTHDIKVDGVKYSVALNVTQDVNYYSLMIYKEFRVVFGFSEDSLENLVGKINLYLPGSNVPNNVANELIGNVLLQFHAPYEEDEQVIAHVFLDGVLVDKVFNIDTAITYIQEGYVVIATKGEGDRSKFVCQKLYNHERELYVDCFGE